MPGLRETICLKVTPLLSWQSAWGPGVGLFWPLPAAASGRGVGYFSDSVSVTKPPRLRRDKADRQLFYKQQPLKK